MITPRKVYWSEPRVRPPRVLATQQTRQYLVVVPSLARRAAVTEKHSSDSSAFASNETTTNTERRPQEAVNAFPGRDVIRHYNGS